MQRVSVREILERKRRIAAKLASIIGDEGVRRARGDWHARRQPIPCGMTIHTGVGCSYGCAYCYIYDMGFTSKPKPYPLSGEELAYALAVNPYVVPGNCGTLLAFGSVTEPFMRETVWRAIEYFKAARDHLGNPQQVSTKTALKGLELEEFLKSADPRIDVLISITTLSMWRKLEPGASSPDERFEFMRHLSSRGIHVTLFLRPIVPGVTDRELEEIIRRAAEAGAKAVVPGTLRVTHRILRRLEATGVVDVEEIRRRMPREPRGRGDQVPIRGRDLKERAVKLALEYGLKVLPASCGANIVSHGQACAACRMGPCGDQDLLPHIDEGDVEYLLEHAGLTPIKVEIEGEVVYAEARGSRGSARLAEHLIIGLARRRPVIRVRG